MRTEPHTPPNRSTRRSRCARCQRPSSHCLCALIPSLNNQTPVTILQDPDESRHALNTARLAALGLRQSQLLIGDQHPVDTWQHAAYEPWLLFPGDEAISLDELSTHAALRPVQLIVPDGTWKKAAGLLRNNAELAQLPRVALPAGLAGRYRIRKAPRDGALSTIEAIVHALNVLDAPQCFDALLAPFDALIAGQIAAMGSEVYHNNYQQAQTGNA